MVPNLLTLSLTETTREEESYQVIARDLDNERWVMMHVPRTQFREGSDPVWDLFGITTAFYNDDPGDPRPEKCILDMTQTPIFQGPILDDGERLQILQGLLSDDLGAIYEATDVYIGIVNVAGCHDITWRPKTNTNQKGYDLNKLFFWEARVAFADNRRDSELSLPCKDLRWKQYLYNVHNRRPDEFEDVKRKWMDYMNTHHTFFIIEIYPPWQGHNYAAISGAHCLPFERPAYVRTVPPWEAETFGESVGEFGGPF